MKTRFVIEVAALSLIVCASSEAHAQSSQDFNFNRAASPPLPGPSATQSFTWDGTPKDIEAYSLSFDADR